MPQKLPKRGSVYYHRRVIPNDLKVALGINERWVTLGTKDLAEAKAKWREADYKFELYLQEVRRQVRAGTWTRRGAEASSGETQRASVAYAEALEWSLDVSDPETPPEDEVPYERWLTLRKERDRLEDAEVWREERRSRTLPLLDVFERYAAQVGLRSETAKQWRGVLRHLISFLGHDNALRLNRSHFRQWLDHLATEPGPRGTPRKPKTINDTYLASVRAVLSWAVDRELLSSNPTAKLKPLRTGREQVLRERNLTREEQATILAATLAPPSERLGRHKAAVRRWVPWLCAYTGARVAEITQARSQDIMQIDGIWVLNITPDAGDTKTNRARLVPLHEHLIQQGFLVFAASSHGPLFYDPPAQPREGARAPYKLAANKLADWVRSIGLTDVPQPNHSWRHTFKTLSREYGMDEAAADYIQGHAPANDSRTYGTHSIRTLAAQIGKLPRFDAGTQK